MQFIDMGPDLKKEMYNQSKTAVSLYCSFVCQLIDFITFYKKDRFCTIGRIFLRFCSYFAAESRI
ncbi:hypothetical protein DPQ22_06545 [Candidatus Tokpelaia sp.]|nr:hypothetical protein DPQ22_06545 [Candidatus Tokpelaia sp.]